MAKTKEEIEFWHEKSHYRCYGEHADGYVVVPTSVDALVHDNVLQNELQLYKLRKLVKPFLRTYLKLKHSSSEWWDTPERSANLQKLQSLKKQWLDGSNSIKYYKAMIRCARALEVKYLKEKENE